MMTDAERAAIRERCETCLLELEYDLNGSRDPLYGVQSVLDDDVPKLLDEVERLRELVKTLCTIPSQSQRKHIAAQAELHVEPEESV